jgi:signal transduction histidine kinase
VTDAGAAAPAEWESGHVLTKPPGWDAAIAAGVLVCAVITWFANPGFVAMTGQAAWPPWALLAAFAAGYATVGRRALTRTMGRPLLFGYAVFIALLAGAMTYFVPSLATIQCVAYPLAWCILSGAGAIIASCAIAAAVFGGFMLSPIQQGEPGLLLTSAGIAAVSLAFSLVLGTWISRVFDYAHERARLVDQLTAAQDELAAMHREAGESGERARLARELHDTVTQSLTGLVMLAERTAAEARAGGQPEPAALELIEETARDALAEARALVATMTPPSGDSSLAEALQRLAARFERETGVTVETNVLGPHLPRDREVVLLRCAQEGLANVRKHARASRVTIEIVAADGAEISLRVVDDGVGPAGASDFTDGGFGIAGMRERVGMLGGRLTLAGRADGGAELAVTIPAAAP